MIFKLISPFGKSFIKLFAVSYMAKSQGDMARLGLTSAARESNVACIVEERAI